MKTSPVSISGIGCLCAAGPNLSECMESMYKGERNPSPPERFSTTHPVKYPVFEIKNEFSDIPGKNGADLLRTSRLAIAAAREAMNDAGLNAKILSGKRVGVCMGTTVGSAMNNEDFYKSFREGEEPGMDPIKRFLNSNPADSIAREFGLSGPRQTVVNACSSGTDAVGIGASWIRAGICDVVIAGGADELCRVTYNGFSSLLIVDASPCKPFDETRKGLNLGEGAGIMILESEDFISSRGKSARAFVLGYGSSCDAHHLTAPKPDGSGLKRAIAEALESSGKTAGDIAFINAHGTATPDNDRVESKALYDLLKDVPYNSTKCYTGHTLGASGAIEAAFTVACLEESKIPANAGFSTQDPELPSCPAREVTAVSGNAAISESLAFGGNNAVLVLGTMGGSA